MRKSIVIFLFLIPILYISCNTDSNIRIEKLSTQQSNNLYKVCKIWGYLKYYHPEIAKGNFKWDDELLKILPEAISSKNDNDLNDLINQWINSLGKLESNQIVPWKADIKIYPSIDWIYDINLLGNKLSSTLTKVLKAQKPNTNYYVDLAPGVGNPLFKNEEVYKNLKYDDDGIKLIPLFRYWNIIQYYYPYRNLIDDNWDSVLMDFIPKIISADDELSYKLTLLEIIGKVSDTHANIWQKDNVLEKFWGLKAPPVELIILDDGVVISRLLNQSDDNIGVNIGDVIIKVNNEPIEKIISEKIKYCPASNLSTKYRDVAGKLLRTNNDTIKLTIKKNTSNYDVVLNCTELNPAIYLKNVIPSYKIIEENIGYIYPSSLKKDEIDSIMKTLSDTRGLIIDLRCYPSDFIVFKLGKYLIPKPTEFVKFTKGSLSQPGEFSFKYTLKVGEFRDDFYKNKVIILLNEKTQSQAEYTAMALRVAPKAKVIGSTTAGADGNVSTIILPGNIRTMISGIGVYYPDGTETQRIGIVPDIAMRPTIKGIRNEEDELLNKAIELINDK